MPNVDLTVRLIPKSAFAQIRNNRSLSGWNKRSFRPKYAPMKLKSQFVKKV